MNADLLLQHFNRISEAPDAVARLRRFILDLAVRGKLVEQDPKDEPVSVLLKRIWGEKERLNLAERGKQLRSQATNIKVPFGTPPSWKWVPLGEVVRIRTGKLDANAAVKGGRYPFFTCSQTPLEIDSYSFDTAAVLLAGNGDFNLKCYKGKFDAYQRTYVIEPLAWNLEFCFILLRSQIARITENNRGSAIAYLKLGDITDPMVPIPPLPEQHRIVAKVDELMALCDQLDAAKAEREARRDRLVAASLNRIGTAPPDELPDAARFHLAHLPRLSTRIEHIKEMRQTILNLAVRGRLVAQDSNDEPASALLKRIAVEKTRLFKEGKAEKAKPEAVIADGDIPYAAPAGWKWVRLGQICSKTGSGSTPRGGKEAYVSSGVPFLRSQNVYDDGLRLNSVAFITNEIHQRMKGTAVTAGDLLLNITGGSIGRCAIVPDDFEQGNISQHVAIIRLVLKEVNAFSHLIIISPYFQNEIVRSQTGAGREGLPKNRMDEIAVSLPPLAEQRRIVAKVDELMALCDKLEAQITATQTDSRRLLEAVLRDTLAPALAEAA